MDCPALPVGLLAYDAVEAGANALRAAFEQKSSSEKIFIVDAVAEWATDIESGPGEYDYAPGYYAVFFYDPDGLKLEVVHQP